MVSMSLWWQDTSQSHMHSPAPAPWTVGLLSVRGPAASGCKLQNLTIWSQRCPARRTPPLRGQLSPSSSPCSHPPPRPHHAAWHSGPCPLDVLNECPCGPWPLYQIMLTGSKCCHLPGTVLRALFMWIWGILRIPGGVLGASPQSPGPLPWPLHPAAVWN